MSTNPILATKFIGNAFKAGKKYEVHMATKTAAWIRLDVGVGILPSEAKELVEGSKKSFPEETAVVVFRDGEHTSPEDKRNHYTVCLQDKDGNHIRTDHLTKRKE